MQLLLSAAYALPTLEVFARGGGGGSGGGGSGGGGGSLFALIGYVPCHFVSGWVTKQYTAPMGILTGSIVGVIVTWVMAGLLLPLFPFEIFVVFLGAAIGVWTGSQNLFGKLKQAALRTKKVVATAASKDPAWQEESLNQTIAKTFAAFQHDWSTFNIESIKTYTTPKYFGHVSLMLAALRTMHRRNQVDDVKLGVHYITDAIDSPDDTKDTFTAVITASAKDQLIDEAANKTVYVDTSAFTEYWRFVRDGNIWRLDGIDQATADITQLHSPLQKFAKESGMYYSLDWGWLLLPQRGQLFSQAGFKNSDINNHVIGQWNGIIVQIYTYRPQKYNQGSANYQIAQITLPKSYGGIIVKRKGLINVTPPGYQKITFEWPDFNNRYVVYATDADKITSFELLNPKFMAELYDQNIKVNIEVVDNVVYLYSKVQATQINYAGMLYILQMAFKELKL